MTWKLADLADAVNSKFGADQRNLLVPVLQSITDRRGFASFHHQQARKLITPHLVDKDNADRLKLEVGVSADNGASYRIAKQQACARIVASLQSVHCLADTLAHVIYFSLGLNLSSHKAHKERDISLPWMEKVLGKLPDLGEISHAVVQLKDHEDFRYLDDVVNRSKHRSVVRAGVTQHLDESAQTPWTLELQSFERESTAIPHPSRPVDPFLTEEFSRQTRLTFEICQLLSTTAQ